MYSDRPVRVVCCFPICDADGSGAALSEGIVASQAPIASERTGTESGAADGKKLDFDDDGDDIVNTASAM